jgi:hypothetical protein
VGDGAGDLLSAEFASAAMVRRINRGLRRRANPGSVGFIIDPRSGYWAGTQSGADEDSPIKTRQAITPVVEDRKNALLLRFPTAWLAEGGDQAELVVTTIQHALARGIEAVYQLEEGEILVEPTPSRRERRALLFYEAAEGGAGALSRLVREPAAFRAVAQEALEIMHYDPASFAAARTDGPDALKETGAHCVAGCYRCLLSYFNQPDHELIDRRSAIVRQFLIRLANADVRERRDAAPGHEGLDGCPPPDAKPLEVDGFSIPLVWRKARIAAVERADAPPDLAEGLAGKGIDLVVLPTNGDERRQAIAGLVAALGEKAA